MKKGIIGFVLGAIIFGSIGTVVAYTMLAKDVAYTPNNTKWKVDNVEGALDDLYSKAKPEYTGSATVTPTESNQTLSTKDKILKSDITINAIPSTYKNLTTTTNVSANNLLNGVKAYTSDGSLVTGNLSMGSANCIKSTYLHNANSQLNIQLPFTPSMFYISHNMPNGDTISLIHNSNIENNVYMHSKINNSFDTTTEYFVSTNSIISNMPTSRQRYVQEYDVYYMACR